MDTLKNNQKNTHSGNSHFLAGVILLIITLFASGVFIQYTQKRVQTALQERTLQYQERENQIQNQIDMANTLYLAEANRINAESNDPLDPDYLVNQLYKLDDSVNEYERNNLAFYCLQGLLINETNALPAIKNLLINGHNFHLSLKKIYPSRTLRQEIMTLLISMKNRPAADLLSQLLPATQDAAEMRRLCETLLSVSDDYRPYCIKAAREIYDRLISEQKDTNANVSEIKSMRSILLQLLQDREFAVDLMEQKAWRKENGKVDSDLLLLSHEVLHDSIIPYCYEAMLYQQENHKEIDPFLAGIAQEYIAYPQASEIVLNSLKSIVSPSDRYRFVINLFPIDEDFSEKTGYIHFINNKETDNNSLKTTNSETIQKANDRLLFLNTVATEYGDDEIMLHLLDIIRSSLQHTASTDPGKGEWTVDDSTKEFIQDIMKR